MAREKKADLFLSIHADAIQNRAVKGSSVYILSNRGASSELARRLASQANSADFIGSIFLATIVCIAVYSCTATAIGSMPT